MGTNWGVGLGMDPQLSELGENNGDGGVCYSRGLTWWGWKLRGHMVAGDHGGDGGNNWTAPWVFEAKERVEKSYGG